MGVALRKTGISLSTFHGAKCDAHHQPRHILRAQELATWIHKNPKIFGNRARHITRVTSADFKDKTGLVFIQDGWGPTDHIDVWNGSQLKAGSLDYFARGKELWFWEL